MTLAEDPINMDTTDTGAMGGQIGLTKREYFAAIAMQSILRYAFDNEISGGMFKSVAIDSVRAADALINELNTG